MGVWLDFSLLRGDLEVFRCVAMGNGWTEFYEADPKTILKWLAYRNRCSLEPIGAGALRLRQEVRAHGPLMV